MHNFREQFLGIHAISSPWNFLMKLHLCSHYVKYPIFFDQYRGCFSAVKNKSNNMLFNWKAMSEVLILIIYFKDFLHDTGGTSKIYFKDVLLRSCEFCERWNIIFINNSWRLFIWLIKLFRRRRLWNIQTNWQQEK